jgi:hypothetical protein
MGFGLSLGGSSKKEKSTTDREQELSGTTNTTGQSSGWGGSQSSFWTPEQQGLAARLSGLLGGSWGGTSQAQKTGVDSLTRAATGQGYQNIIDPKASNELYASIEKQTLEDILPKATNAIAKEANLAGMLRSGPALQMQLQNRNEVVNQLMQTLSGLKYQDETQRRDIEREREGRQASAGQALITSDPQQQQINNILSMLGIRGSASETSRQSTQQQSTEDIARQLDEFIKSKGKTTGMSAGLSAGL